MIWVSHKSLVIWRRSSCTTSDLSFLVMIFSYTLLTIHLNRLLTKLLKIELKLVAICIVIMWSVMHVIIKNNMNIINIMLVFKKRWQAIEWLRMVSWIQQELGHTLYIGLAQTKLIKSTIFVLWIKNKFVSITLVIVYISVDFTTQVGH